MQIRVIFVHKLRPGKDWAIGPENQDRTDVCCVMLMNIYDAGPMN